MLNQEAVVTLQPAVFLDRDGVIIENRADYVKSWAEVVILPGALPALRRLSALPFRLAIVTNQSAVGRGTITLDALSAINRRLVQVIRSHGGRIDGVYACPHRPDQGCDCRKPRPGLLHQAAAELQLDLPRSYLIGDSQSDIEAAVAAGVRGILVRTGLGQDSAQRLLHRPDLPCAIVADLAAAVEFLVSTTQNSRHAAAR